MRFRKVLLLLALLWAGGCFAQSKGDLTQSRILILLDGSSSMIHNWAGGEQKFKAAGELIGRLMDSVYAVNDQVEFSLRVFGHQHTVEENYCFDTKNEVPFAKDNRLQMALRLAALQPLGVTPIAYALQQAAEYDLVDEAHNAYSIILITDGGESCGGDICEVMKTLIKNKVYFKPYILSLENDPGLRVSYACMGDYLEVTQRDQMTRAVNTIVDAFRPVLKISSTDYRKLQQQSADVPPPPPPVSVDTLPRAVRTWKDSLVRVYPAQLAELPAGAVPDEAPALRPIGAPPVVKWVAPPCMEVVEVPRMNIGIPVAAPSIAVDFPLREVTPPKVAVARIADVVPALSRSKPAVLPAVIPPFELPAERVVAAPPVKRERPRDDLTALKITRPAIEAIPSPDVAEAAAEPGAPKVHTLSVRPDAVVMARLSLAGAKKPSMLPDEVSAATVPRAPEVRKEAPAPAVVPYLARTSHQGAPARIVPDADFATTTPAAPGVVKTAPPRPTPELAQVTPVKPPRFYHAFTLDDRMPVRTLPPVPAIKMDPAPKPKPGKPALPVADKSGVPPEKRAEVRTETEDTTETTVQVFFTNGKGKFYQSTPQVVFIDPKTNTDVKAFFRTVDADGNPDPRPDVPPGTYNVAFSARRSLLAPNVTIEKNKKNKVFITVKNTNLSFIYGNALGRPVTEFVARVTERNKTNGRIQIQKCTERMEYEPGNYHIEINTFPIDVRNVDLDFDLETAITILQPGFAKFTNTAGAKTVTIYMQSGDKFLRAPQGEFDLADPRLQHLQIQPGQYQAHYMKGPVKSFAAEQVVPFTVTSTAETEVLIK